jgi:leucyl-tRNA synthetase
MICTNELTELKCNKRAILEPLAILISPYAPHLAEELWNRMGHNNTVTEARYPGFNPDYLAENTFEYPVSFNGKLRFKITMPVDAPVPEIEKAVLDAPESQKWLQGNSPKKIIVVPNKIVNVVI